MTFVCYDSEMTKVFYRLIVANRHEDLGKFLFYISKCHGRIGYVVAKDVIEGEDGQSCAEIVKLIDTTGKWQRRCTSGELLDIETVDWCIESVYVPYEGLTVKRHGEHDSKVQQVRRFPSRGNLPSVQ